VKAPRHEPAGPRAPSRLRLLLPRHGGDRRASALAFVLQVALIAVIVPSFVVPIAVDLLRDDAGRVVTPERISFVIAVPPGDAAPTEAPRDGGDGRAPAADPASVEPLAPIVAPSEVPTGVPAAPAAPEEDPGGVGPLTGGGGPTRGVRPSFSDRRLWLPQSEVIYAPAVPLTRVDSMRVELAERIVAIEDSLRRADPQGRAPGDWTFERNGKKYGIDQRMIRLGDFSIPTALLALMPMNAQGNPMARERNIRLAWMRGEIMEQASRVQRDDEFRQAVRALRERKERERREATERSQRDSIRP
jgi:hypothetical protein